MTIFALLLGQIISQEAESKERSNRLLDELKDSHHKLEKSMAQVAELAVTEERNRLARDIHDSLRKRLPDCRILMLTTFNDDEYVV